MTYLPLEMGYLPDWMQTKALEELGETDEIRKETTTELRRLLQEQKDLVTQVDDEYLIQILRSRKYNVKRSLSLILNYYKIKENYKEVHGTPDFAGVEQSMETGFISLLPYRDTDGSAIMVVNFEHWDVEKKKFTFFCHAIAMAALIAIQDPATQVCGLKFIIDLKVISLSHIQHVHPKYLLLLAKGMKNGLPLRIKAIHLVNVNSVFTYFWSALRLALTEKLKNRFFFHTTAMESLHKHLSPELLPKEYGGELPLVNETFVRKFRGMEHFYNDKMSQGYKSSTKKTDMT